MCKCRYVCRSRSEGYKSIQKSDSLLVSGQGSYNSLKLSSIQSGNIGSEFWNQESHIWGLRPKLLAKALGEGPSWLPSVCGGSECSLAEALSLQPLSLSAYDLSLSLACVFLCIGLDSPAIVWIQKLPSSGDD